MHSVSDMKDTMNKIRFESIGRYLPEKVVTSRSVMEQVKTIKNKSVLSGVTGINNMRYCSPCEGSVNLAVKAAKDCLRNSRYNAGDLDIVISTSITHFKDGSYGYAEPATSLFIKEELGADRAINYDLSNACAGMISGAYVLESLIKAGIVRNGMVVSGEYISCVAETAANEVKNIDDPQFASLTVGDSGAAFVMDMSPEAEEGIDFINFVTLSEYAELCVGRVNAKSPGAAMYSNIPELSKAGSGCNFFKYIENTVKENGRRLDDRDYDFIIFHQVTVWNIVNHIKFAKNHLNIKLPEALICANEYGNTATTTHFLALYDAIKIKKVTKHSKLLFIANASGLTLGVLSMSIGELRV